MRLSKIEVDIRAQFTQELLELEEACKLTRQQRKGKEAHDIACAAFNKKFKELFGDKAPGMHMALWDELPSFMKY